MLSSSFVSRACEREWVFISSSAGSRAACLPHSSPAVLNGRPVAGCFRL